MKRKRRKVIVGTVNGVEEQSITFFAYTMKVGWGEMIVLIISGSGGRYG